MQYYYFFEPDPLRRINAWEKTIISIYIVAYEKASQQLSKLQRIEKGIARSKAWLEQLEETL